MKKSTYQAPGKIILSGEYAVVFGYPGIAVPAPFTVTAIWEQSPLTLTLSHREREMRHHELVIRYSGIDNESYLHRILAEVQKYTGPLHGHLAIENTIPIGRGMGSSTALVIAIVRCLSQQFPLPLKGEGRGDSCKKIALSIEATVNPGHSGLDFEVIWNEQPMLFQKGKPPKGIDVSIYRHIDKCVLIDMGKPKETTTEMVKWVKECLGNPHPNPLPSKGEGMRALQTIAHCTERLLTVSRETCHPERSRGALYEIFRDHHRAQIALGVVPQAVQNFIADIEDAGGTAKVIGAGGRSSGGMALALHQKPEKLHIIAQRHGMNPLPLGGRVRERG